MLGGIVQVHPVEGNQFFNTGLHGKSGSGPALVVPGVAMTISQGQRKIGD